MTLRTSFRNLKPFSDGAHNGPPINERSAQQARTQLGELTISLIRNSGIPMLPLMSPPITPPSTSDGPSQHLNTTGSQISDFKMFNQGPYSLPNIPGLPIPLQLPPPPPPMRVPMQTSMPMPIEFNIPMTPPAHRQPIASLLSLPPPPPPLGFLPHPLLFGTLPAQAPPLPSLASDPPGQKMFPMMHAPPSLESVEALHPSLSPRQRMSGAATGLKPPAPPCDSRLSAPLLLPVPPSALKNPPTEPPTLVRSNVPKPSRETESFAKLDAPLQDGQHHGCQNVPQDQPKKKKPSRKPFVRRDPVILR